MRADEIPIRDPFILPVEQQKIYYLYGTTDPLCREETGNTGFEVYTSPDLVHFDGPFPAFRPAPDFWGTGQFWAPEVHFYRGKYYMFASFKAPGKMRGTHILTADNPLGPFHPVSPIPATPREWMCLDGTLYVAPSTGIPYLVFCHEWVQITDGSMEYLELTADLSGVAGQSRTMFHASSAPWVSPTEAGNFVTDGPFLFRDRRQLYLLWSSVGSGRYAMGLARSDNGEISGPWRHAAQPVFAADGGHGMLFATFDGNFMITVHTPNHPHGAERMRLIPVDPAQMINRAFGKE